MNDPLVSLLTRNAIAGVLVGWAVAGGMLALDVGGVGALVFGSDPWWLPFGLMLAFFGFSFGSLAMGSAIMTIGHDDESGGGRIRQAAVVRRAAGP